MSTSSSPAVDSAKAEPEVHPFLYADAGTGANPGLSPSTASAASSDDPARRDEAVRAAGRQEGEAHARAVYEQELARVRDSVRVAIEAFAGERQRYYQDVENEIVQLAFSIARKILHREARMDATLLAGLVRVALDTIERHTKVTVRVHPQYGPDCREYFSRSMDAQELPEVVEDPALEPERCVLETALGTTELGIEVQLKEIEHGVLDLLAQRPQAGR